MSSEHPHVRRITDPAAVSRYTSDESSAFRGSASAVYLPRTADEVGEVVRHAARAGASVTVSGAGTSITGARVPEGGVVLSTERLRDVRLIGAGEVGADAWPEVREADASVRLSQERLALVPAGIRLAELDRLLAPHGLLYPPDPTEMTAMIGGTIATNASGARSYRYGSSRDWIEALLVVTAAGTPVWVRRGDHVARGGVLPLPQGFPSRSVTLPELPLPQTKHAAGLLLKTDADLVDLIVGSEGTLGVVAAAVVRLTSRPQPLLQIAAFYPSAELALHCASLARGDEARGDAGRADEGVLSIEYFDGRALSFIRAQYPDTPQAHACVMFESTYPPVGPNNPYPTDEFLDRWSNRLRDTSSEADWVACGEELQGMRSFRHALPEQVNRWVAARVGKLGTDMAVPASAFPRMWSRYEEARAAGVESVLFGHLGQYHLHLNFLPEDRAQLDRARALYRELARTAVELGGTISAEHGVGKKLLADDDGTLRPYLYFQYGENGIRAIQDVRSAFDPDGLLNPNTMVPRT